MHEHPVILLPGDGIGPAITGAVVRILDAAGASIAWQSFTEVGILATDERDPLPEEVITAIRRAGVALKGPITTPIGKGFSSINVALRKRLDLYANVRPVRSIEGAQSRYENVDVVVVRENTEGLYSGIEHEVIPGVIESLKVMTETGCTRICAYAFDYARRYGRKKVTAVHKANIMKMADGLFLDCFRRVAQGFPDIVADECIVDAACMKLVMEPRQFDVVVMENLYGDIISDVCAGLVGGLGVTPGANIGSEAAIFEAVHGSAPDIAGLNIANPTALLLSSVLMLEHIEQHDVAQRVRAGLHQALRDGKRTKDLGGSCSTTEFTEAVVARLPS